MAIKSKNMKLAEALKNVFEEDQKIRREIWDTVNFVGMRDGTLSIFLADGEYNGWTITTEDVDAIDWILL